MFIQLLDKDERAAFFDLAQQMIVADGIVAEQEMAYLDRLYWESSGFTQAPIDDVHREVDLTVFASERSRLVVGAELLIIAVVDGEYHAAEAEFANRIIHDLGITHAQHETLCLVAENAANALVTMRTLIA